MARVETAEFGHRDVITILVDVRNDPWWSPTHCCMSIVAIASRGPPAVTMVMHVAMVEPTVVIRSAGAMLADTVSLVSVSVFYPMIIFVSVLPILA
jgi:hypothetical protein